MLPHITRFLADESGPTAVEYAMMLALIVVAAVGAIGLLGTSASGSLDTTNTQMQAAGLGS